MIGPQSIHKAYSYLFMTSSINSQQYVGAAFRLPRGFAGELKTKMSLIWVLSLSRVMPTQTHTHTSTLTGCCCCVCLALSDQGPGPLQGKKAIKGTDWSATCCLFPKPKKPSHCHLRGCLFCLDENKLRPRARDHYVSGRKGRKSGSWYFYSCVFHETDSSGH